MKFKETLLTILSGTQKKNLLVTGERGLDANIKRNKVLLIILFLSPLGLNSKLWVGFYMLLGGGKIRLPIVIRNIL